ncbi:hypothetical protein KAH37_02130 [bacterium]|nr:hypothetical protein [bacterium]
MYYRSFILIIILLFNILSCEKHSASKEDNDIYNDVSHEDGDGDFFLLTKMCMKQMMVTSQTVMKKKNCLMEMSIAC